MNVAGKRIRIAVTLAALVLAPMAAWAGQGIMDPSASTCSATNCQGITLIGVYDVSLDQGDTVADCFRTQVYTAGDECVRLDVDQEQQDLELVLVCPDGTVWRNDDDDDRNDLRPLIKAETRTKGWCAVQVCHYAGQGEGMSQFRLRYGRYRLGNRNCAGRTQPLKDEDGVTSDFSSSEGKAGEF